MLIVLRDPRVVALVAYVGSVSRQLGYQQAEEDMAASWRAAGDPIRRLLKQPTFEERQRRRYGVRHGTVQIGQSAVTG